MRKRVVSALMMILLLLPGCGEREKRLEEGFQALRDAVTAAQSIRFRAAVTADYGDSAAEYTMNVSYDGSQTTIELLTPEILAGVKAVVTRGESQVSYDGVMLGAGPLDGEGLTPVGVLPALLDALASGYVELLWWDGEIMAARLYVGENSVLTVWLDGQSLAPTAAEIASEGRTVATVHIEGWEIS